MYFTECEKMSDVNRLEKEFLVNGGDLLDFGHPLVKWQLDLFCFKDSFVAKSGFRVRLIVEGVDE